MRAMPIKAETHYRGWQHAKISFKKNWKHYLQEALGLAIFMISACFFSSLFFSEKSPLFQTFDSASAKNILTGILMGATALFIFYSPWTSPSGSQINPAVTLSFLRVGKICHWDALFYILFQFLGGTVAVYFMGWILSDALTQPPVNYAVTIPVYDVFSAFFTEFIIAFITMSMVLFTSSHPVLQKFTRVIAACLVCIYVIIAGPISGFGMNPARSFASALPAGIWTAFWIYAFVPVAGMLLAAELHLLFSKEKNNSSFITSIK
jgi:aquaporin Z